MQVIISDDEGIVFGEYALHEYIEDVRKDYKNYFPNEPDVTEERLYKEGLEELIDSVVNDIRHLAE